MNATLPAPQATSWDLPKTSKFDKRKMRKATPGEVAVKLRDLRAKKNEERSPDEPRLTNAELKSEASLPCTTSFLHRLEDGDRRPWLPKNAVRLGTTIAALAVYYGSSVEAIMERE